MERITVEQNGERFTLEVEDGTTDEQIRQFLSQQQGGPTGLTSEEAPLTTGEQIAAGTAAAVLPSVVGYGVQTAANKLGPAVVPVAKAAGSLVKNMPMVRAAGQAYTAAKAAQAAMQPKVSTGPVAPSNTNLQDFVKQQGRYAPPSGAAPQQPTAVQKGMEIASKMREIAASKVVQGARAAAPVAGAVAPMAALGAATQQAATADMNQPGFNIFGSTARAGKQFADWANSAMGQDEKYRRMREAQQAQLRGPQQ